MILDASLGEANRAGKEFVSKLACIDIQLEWLCYVGGNEWMAKGLYR